MSQVSGDVNMLSSWWLDFELEDQVLVRSNRQVARLELNDLTANLAIFYPVDPRAPRNALRLLLYGNSLRSSVIMCQGDAILEDDVTAVPSQVLRVLYRQGCGEDERFSHLGAPRRRIA